MNRFVFCCLLLAPQMSFGQFGSRVEQDPAELLAEFEQQFQLYSAALAKDLPERDLKVKTEAPVTWKFTRPDPKLLENKFVATFALRPAGAPGTSRQSYEAFTRSVSNLSGSSFDGDIPEALRSEGLSLIQVLHPLVATPPDDSALPKHFQWLAKRCPPASRPDEDQVAFFTSPDCQRTIKRFAMDVEGVRFPVKDTVFQIQASTAEAAEDRAKAIIRLYDAGFSRPMQGYFLGEFRKALEAAREQHAKIKSNDSAIAAEQQKLAKPSEITSDILKELKAQKVMVAVELAGLSARVKACDAMLQDSNKLRAAALQSVGDMKVKAEIERVGIKEKLDAINAFIAEGSVRDDAQAKLTQLLGQRIELSRTFGFRLAARVSAQIELLKLFEPFEIPDNQITVAPLEWTE